MLENKVMILAGVIAVKLLCKICKLYFYNIALDECKVMNKNRVHVYSEFIILLFGIFND